MGNERQIVNKIEDSVIQTVIIYENNTKAI